ncbi:hypothetical protein VIGAN_03015000 [Vigna angularis var. angularis]|uniref:Uncharacterized protein n=1 Tax=Vigna angularis var. angularis TaxID=157739 RepID=A0A0S3RJA2_PHAAN|nr:hypothetical protein VIGAN_03015000 [Vigna angularis var. angularis]
MKLQLILLAEKKHKHPPYGPAAGPAVGGSSSHVYTSKCHGWKQRMLVEEKHTDTNKNGGALTLFSHGQVNYFLTAKNARKRCSLKDKEASREELQNRAIKKQAAEKEQGGEVQQRVLDRGLDRELGEGFQSLECGDRELEEKLEKERKLSLEWRRM